MCAPFVMDFFYRFIIQYPTNEYELAVFRWTLSDIECHMHVHAVLSFSVEKCSQNFNKPKRESLNSLPSIADRTIYDQQRFAFSPQCMTLALTMALLYFLAKFVNFSLQCIYYKTCLAANSKGTTVLCCVRTSL